MMSDITSVGENGIDVSLGKKTLEDAGIESKKGGECSHMSF